MTIDSTYIPEVYANNGTVNYRFMTELAEDNSEVVIYTIDADGVYTLLPDTEYTVTLNAYRLPIADGANIVLNEPLPDDVVSISINRVTDITDEQDFPTGEPFNAESFEFQADKLTLILQEINAVVCDCRGKEVV